ncbi:LicD family protein [Candidatus Saccharibacteria bacterium]|nr:LicD family protein [Candidatus Saccharibacteria bacterium]
MKKITPTQDKLLNLYKSFKRVCEENHLRYYAVAGTAIGAVRHHGFIPWDDDIDLGMPVEDLYKLKKILLKKPIKNVAFKESYWMGGKIHDTKTTVIDIRFINRPQNYHGIYIDIFPLIGLPDKASDRQKFIEDIKSFQTNAELLEFYPETSPFSVKEINRWKKHLLYAYDFNKSKKLAALCYFMCDGDGIRNPIIVPFEDTSIPVSSNYDWDLSNHFGNYMELPPENERKTHDKYHLVDLNHPYNKYIKDYNNTKPQWLIQLINQNHLIEGELTQFSNSLQYILNEKESIIKQKTREIENLHSQINLKEKETKDILNSTTFKTGNFILKPIKTIRRIIHHE